MSDLDLLRRLGEQIVPPPLDDLRETARLRTRRTATFATVAAGAVVALVVGAVQLGVVHHSPPPPTHEPEKNSSRPLTYGERSTLHYGDQTVAMPSQVVELDLTDDGVVARTSDGGIWFTDGSEPERIGALGTPAAAFEATKLSGGSPDVAFGTSSGFIVSPTSGSLVGWLEFAGPRQPELVVYDTAAGSETVRDPVKPGLASSAIMADVTEDAAYWYIDPVAFDDPAAVGRLDLATGEQSRLTVEQYDAEHPAPEPGTPQTLLVSHHEGGGAPYEVDDAIHMQLGIDARRIVPRGEMPLEVLDGPTHTRFTFDAPAGYDDPDPYPGWLTQWVDDDTVVIGYRSPKATDVLECHVSTRACKVAAHTDGVAVLPETGTLPDS